MARPRRVPGRHGGRKAHLRRPVPAGESRSVRRASRNPSAQTSSRSRTGTATTSATPWRSRSSTARPSSHRSSSPAGSASRASPSDKPIGFNKGGTVDVDGVKFTLTNAFHSSSTPDGSYGGEAAGFVVEAEDGTKLYFAGDTCVFGDMAADRPHLRARRRGHPDRRPLHDGPARSGRRARAARRRSVACRATGARSRRLTGTPAALAGARSRRDGRADRARRLGDGVRERWFGATGRRVPELALAGRARARTTRSSSTTSDDVERSAHGVRRRHAGRRARGVRRADHDGARAARGGVRRRPGRPRPSCSSSTSPI